MVESSGPSPNEASGSSNPAPEKATPVRVRVWRACEVCRKRKVKCNGQEPCSYCISSGKTCSFKELADHSSVARQFVQASTVETRLSRVEDALQKLVPLAQTFETWMRANPNFRGPTQNVQGKQDSQTGSPSSTASPRSRYKPSLAIQSLTNGPSSSTVASSTRGPGHTDGAQADGPERWTDRFSHLTKDSYGNLRYTGGTSSFMLIDALTTLENTKGSQETPAQPKNTVDINLPFFAPGKHFRALEHLPRAEDVEYPPSELADELVAVYFSHIHHTFPILHQQTFVERYTAIMEGYHSGQPSNDIAFVACMFAVFACGACLRNGQTTRIINVKDAPSEFSGMDFYEKAQLLYWMAYGSATIAHVQTLAIMAICNASWNTLAQSWINAGAAIRRAQDMGLHRVARRSGLTHFEKELRRRVWWCVYGLDKALSIALGRPSGTHDDDCNVEMPAELDDTQLMSRIDGRGSSPLSEPSYMTGFVALLKIYIISGKIARFVQSTWIDDPQSERVRNAVAQLDGELNAWKETTTAALRTDLNDMTRPKMRVLCLITYLIYYSAIINLHRPFIPDYPDASRDLGSFGRCVGAARTCIQIGHLIQEGLPTSHYLAFAVQYITLSGVLLLRCVTYVNDQNFVQSMISDAEKCTKILDSVEERWPAAKRCKEIVLDLLIIVKAKVYGGPSAVQNLQAAQQAQLRNDSDDRSQSPHTMGKRKRSPHEQSEAPSQRMRHERYRDKNTTWHEITGAPAPTSQIQRKYSENGEVDDGARRHMQLSNLRTSMADSPEHAMQSPTQIGPPHALHVNGHHSSIPRDEAHSGHPGTGFHSPQYPTYPNGGGGGNGAPQISLNLNMTAGTGVDGLPYSGYDFLGNDVYATIDNTMKPAPETGSHVYDEQSQFLWHAYNRPQEVQFSAGTQ